VDDAEARERIIEAAMRCIDRYGPTKTGLSDVAAELGVTRQTVYRLFTSTDELLLAVTAAAADTFVDRMVARVRDLTDPAEMLVECLAFTVEQLPRERYLSLLFGPQREATAARGITSSRAFDLANALLSRLPVDWPAGRTEQQCTDVLAEMYLRTLQSFATDPGPPRSASHLRAFLHAWLAPAVHSLWGAGAGSGG
jgi:AcrR family transcriptional regulator